MCGNKPLNHFPCCPVETVVANVWQAPNGSIALIVANHGTEPTKYEARADLGSTSHSIAVTLPPTSARIVVLTESETVVAVSRVVEQPQLHSEEGASAGTAPGICDIYAHGGTPCVAAHSMTRALYAVSSLPLSHNSTFNSVVFAMLIMMLVMCRSTTVRCSLCCAATPTRPRTSASHTLVALLTPKLRLCSAAGRHNVL